MNQLSLLSFSPIARTTDPVSSHLAAEEITKDKSRARQQRMTLDAVQLYPGHTSMEISKIIGTSRYTLARRLPELEHAGLIEKGPARVCSVSGRQAVTWVET